MQAGAVILAAGQSRRMTGIDKVFAKLGNRPILARVLDVFQECDVIDKIVVVLNHRNLEQGQQLIDNNNWPKVSGLCPGGERRQDSVYQGLNMIGSPGWVVIHDGARPLVSSEMIELGLAEAKKTGAAIAAVPVKDTIKNVGSAGFVDETLERDRLWAVQTPQVFRFDLLSQAHARIAADVNDDAAMVEKMGHKVKVFMGSYNNIKVTTPEDLAFAEIILSTLI